MRALLPVAALLMLVAAVAFNGGPVNQAALRMMVVALQDPFALFSKRSPGSRAGPLVSVKEKTGPRERVLSTVRDRPQVADIAPVVLDMPVVVDIPPGEFFTPASLSPGITPGTTPGFTPSLTPGEIIGSPFVPTTPFTVTVPGFTPGETPPPQVAIANPEVPPSPPSTPTVPLVPPIIGSNPTETPPTQTPPGNTPGTPPGTPATPPGTPPGTPGTPPDTPPFVPPIIIPEPPTFSMLLLGLIATAFTARRKRKWS